MKIKAKNKKDKEMAEVLDKIFRQWMKKNPCFEYDIKNLYREVMIFNLKWGTEIELKINSNSLTK